MASLSQARVSQRRRFKTFFWSWARNQSIAALSLQPPTGRRIQAVVATPTNRIIGWVLPSGKQVRAYRGQIVSPGRPAVAWRQDRVRFWVAIAAGKKTREAGDAAGVSEPVAHRWFRDAGGVNPQLPPAVSNRYLSPLEREDIALWRAQGAGVREIARRLGRAPSTISRELRRNASTRTYLEHSAYGESIIFFGLISRYR